MSWDGGWGEGGGAWGFGWVWLWGGRSFLVMDSLITNGRKGWVGAGGDL